MAASMSNQNNMEAPQQTAEPQEQQMSPEQQKEVDAYSTGLLNMVYDKKTGPLVYDMLKSAPPEQSIPHATLTINSRMEDALKAKGQTPKLGVILASNIQLIGELINVGHTGGFFEVPQEQVPNILQTSIKAYIQDGLKKKTIDPVELQKSVEPLMNDEQKQQGLGMASETGVPHEPGVNAALETYATQRMSQQQQMASNQQAAQSRQQAQGQLQQAAQQGGAQ